MNHEPPHRIIHPYASDPSPVMHSLMCPTPNKVKTDSPQTKYSVSELPQIYETYFSIGLTYQMLPYCEIPCPRYFWPLTSGLISYLIRIFCHVIQQNTERYARWRTCTMAVSINHPTKKTLPIVSTVPQPDENGLFIPPALLEGCPNYGMCI